MTTGFYWDESCFWHSGGNYALTAPVRGLVQPLAAGGLPESPETKRRLKNLMDVTGLSKELNCLSAPAASREDLQRIHPDSYLDHFKSMSDAGGGEIGLTVPFGSGAYEIAALSAGLSIAALNSVLSGEHKNAYALSRPPGHHCLPDFPNGFCLMANIAIAIEHARAAGTALRFAVVDWDVHHGNGTEAIFYDRDDVLTISLHQERNYPLDTGGAEDTGKGDGVGYNVNVPLFPGAGHQTYLDAVDRIVAPKLRDFRPDVIVIACGFDASIFDPLGHMLCTAQTYREMTHRVMALAEELCGGKLMMAHEGGYSEMYVPFCGHAVLEEMSGSAIEAPDPKADVVSLRQPSAQSIAFFADHIGELARHFGTE